MVIAGRTGRLLKTNKSVSVPSVFSLSSCNILPGYKNYYNHTRNSVSTKYSFLSGTQCDCPKFYSSDYYFQSSKESRTTFSKLSPQELLVINAQWITPEQIAEPLALSKRAALLENPLYSFAKYIDSTYFKPSDQLLTRSNENFQTRLANEDPLEFLLNLFTLSQEKRLEHLEVKIAQAGNDIESVVNAINSEIGGRVFAVNNRSLKLDADAIAKLIESQSTTYIRDLFKDNFLLQLSLQQAVKKEIRKQLPELRQTLDSNALPLSDIQKLIAAATRTGLTRSKRSVASNILSSILQTYLSPVQTVIEGLFDDVASFILCFYISDLPSNGVLQAIANTTNNAVTTVAQAVTVYRGYVTLLFESFYNSTSSRRRRDAEFDLKELVKVLDVDERGLEIHSRQRRSSSILSSIGSAISSLFSFIWSIIKSIGTTLFSGMSSVFSGLWSVLKTVFSALLSGLGSSFNLVKAISSYLTGGISGLISYVWGVISVYLNSAIKSAFISWLSSYYETIGEWVTYPIRWVVNYLIDLIFPCSSCSDIV